MIAFDATFLVDYLDEVPATEDFLDANRDKPFFAPTLALFEVYRGSARVGGREAVETVRAGLNWIDPLELTEATAREAAVIEAELLGRGEAINLGDVMIAGVCRHTGARLVTRDGHFQHVDGLDTVDY